MVDRSEPGPLSDLDQWEDDLRRRYPEPTATHCDQDQGAVSRLSGRRQARGQGILSPEPPLPDCGFCAGEAGRVSCGSTGGKMGLWDGLEFLNTLVDGSDPDTSLAQIEHLLQTAEAIRRDGHPRWFILTGLIHDFGKVLCLFGEPQWAVVGDTFPVGCAYSDKIVFSEFLADNPDSQVERVSDALRHLRAGLRAGQRADVLGPRRIHVPRRQGLPAARGAVHDSLPLVLSGPSRAARTNT